MTDDVFTALVVRLGWLSCQSKTMFKREVDQTCTALYYMSYNSVKKAPRAHVTVLLVNSTLSLKNKNSEPLKTRKNYLLFSRIQKVYKSMLDK